VECKCGIDMIEIERVKKALSGSVGDSFSKRVFTEREHEYCEGRGKGMYQSYAGRFAAKEAFAKAIGTGIGKDVRLNEVEILNSESGNPYITCSGVTGKMLKERGITQIDVSITHIEEIASAVVVLVMD